MTRRQQDIIEGLAEARRKALAAGYNREAVEATIETVIDSLAESCSIYAAEVKDAIFGEDR